MSFYSFLADVVVVLHLAYACVIVFGLLFIVIGIIRGWQWIRNPWFRFTHLAMILIVVVEELLGFVCPLTTLENSLRRQAGEAVQEGTSIGKLVHDFLFFDGPPIVLTTTYYAVGVLVVATFTLAPPRRKRPQVE